MMENYYDEQYPEAVPSTVSYAEYESLREQNEILTEQNKIYKNALEEAIRDLAESGESVKLAIADLKEVLLDLEERE